MNKLESRYYGMLDLQTKGLAADVASVRFEAIKLRLADSTFYTPDFFVVRADGGCEFHEVKGHWEDDARVKVKVAAEAYPEFVFIGVTWHRQKGWQYERFGGDDADLLR